MIFFLGAVALAAICAGLVFGGVLKPHYQRKIDLSAFGEPVIDYRPVDFRALPGWMQDDLAPAFSAFLLSCEALLSRDDDAPANTREQIAGDAPGLSGLIIDWREPCSRARAINGPFHTTPAAARSSIRSFFEYHFTPIQILHRREPLQNRRGRRLAPVFETSAKFTGYFEPAYRASRYPTAQFSMPLYPRPDNLVEVDLGAFREELSGERIAGRIESGRLVPYWDRKAINAGALDDDVEPLAWLAPDDLFFLQIQGSGQLLYSPDEAVRIGYAAQNGQPYTAIGRVMVERGLMPLEDVSMQSIRDWLDDASPDKAADLREQNASYVFFRELPEPVDGLGPPGAQNVALTPERSLAVDMRFHTLGAPIWVDIEPIAGVTSTRIQKLMIAQDTGGAIRGPLRGDVFWGAGSYAADIAGKMNAAGSFYVLVPNTVLARLSEDESLK